MRHKPLTFTQRQLEVIALIAHGCSYTMIGERLGISSSTAKQHIEVVKHKLGAERTREVPALYAAATNDNPFLIEVPAAVAV